MQEGPCITENEPEATQTFATSINRLLPNESANDTSPARNTIDLNSPTSRNDSIGPTQLPGASDTEYQSQYWNEFNACEYGGVLNLPNEFLQPYCSGSSSSVDKWSYLSNDWNFFNDTASGNM